MKSKVKKKFYCGYQKWLVPILILKPIHLYQTEIKNKSKFSKVLKIYFRSCALGRLYKLKLKLNERINNGIIFFWRGLGCSFPQIFRKTYYENRKMLELANKTRLKR